MTVFEKTTKRGEAPRAFNTDMVSQFDMPWVTFRLSAERPSGTDARAIKARHDGLLEATILSRRCKTYRFAVEYKRLWTPQAFLGAVQKAQLVPPPQLSGRGQRDLLPLVVLPYLSEDQLRELVERAVSGLDLCGNGVLTVPQDGLLLFRTGRPNRFRTSAPLKNVYRGASALVARTLLLRADYPSVDALWQETRTRGAAVSLATVSKVLKVLEEDLIVSRKNRTLRLLQPEKLLDKLRENYALPRVVGNWRGKVSLDLETLKAALVRNAANAGAALAATGVGSVVRYAVMATEDTLAVYTDTAASRLLGDLPVAPAGNRFPNLEIRETQDRTVYFDAQPDLAGYPWASPLQTYLEMAQGEERLYQSAEQVRERILADLKEAEEQRLFAEAGTKSEAGSKE